MRRWAADALDAVDRGGKWPHWQQTDPRVAAFASLADVVEAWTVGRDERCYEVVAALTILGSRRGGDDDDAALAVGVLLHGGIDRLAMNVGDVCEFTDVVTAVWESVKDAEPTIGRMAARYLLQRARQRLTRPAAGLVARGDTYSLEEWDPDRAGGLAVPDVEDPVRDLVDLLGWARSTGVIDADEVDLLVELMAAENDGLAREEAQRVVAERHGLSMRTIRRRRDNTAARLRDAAPQYLAATA